MIYDCFTFFNELDLLEIRLNVLKDVVDKFVLVEAPITHTGKPKPLYYAENRLRYNAFTDRIIHVVVEDFTSADGAKTVREKAWSIENLQRNAIAWGIKDARAEDTIIISDLDEIPNPDAIKRAIGLSGITRLEMMPCCYYLNLVSFSMYPGWRLGTQVLSVATFRNRVTYEGFVFGEYVVAACNPVPSATIVRFLRSNRTLRCGGWHFSYLGGVDAVQQKIGSIAHTEYCNDATLSKAFITARIQNGEDIFKRGDHFFPLPIEGRFPRYIVEHQGELSRYLVPVDDNSLRRTRFQRLFFRTRGLLRAAVVACVPAFLVGPLSRLMQRMNMSRIGGGHL